VSDTFREVPWPRIRELVVDVLTVAARTHTGYGLVEVDVTEPLARISELKARTPGSVSFTAYLPYCLGRAVAAHPDVQACRAGARRLALYDDVDVNTLLEKIKSDGTSVPVLHVVRDAGRKTLAEINDEVREAVRDDLYDHPAVRRRRRILRLPRAARRLVWWWLRRDPVRRKRQYGTVSLSNIGAALGVRPSWGLAPSILPCSVIVGGIFERVGWRDGQARPRQVMSVTVVVDHDLVDGMPGARFTETFADLLERGAGLDEVLLGRR
jgi:pyruvate/2-oxoglutarate dehydrogenase complex dihydrolipoamide acyltransferase (E2) component